LNYIIQHMGFSKQRQGTQFQKHLMGCLRSWDRQTWSDGISAIFLCH
jgi:hypothetical protein